VVDDEVVDRYIVLRHLSKESDFGEVREMPSGQAFLDAFFSDQSLRISDDVPLLILMDINMPGLNGFETVEEMQRRKEQGFGPTSIVVLMFTSSNNPTDKQRAQELDFVNGFITKPLSDTKVDAIRKLYLSS